MPICTCPKCKSTNVYNDDSIGVCTCDDCQYVNYTEVFYPVYSSDCYYNYDYDQEQF